MASEVTNYQCPACTAPLRFDGESGKLVCDFCGSSYSVKEVEELYAQKDAAAARASEAKETAPPEETGWGDDGDNLQMYQCPTCGAELICEKTTAATSCPYCGNPTVVPGQLSGGRKPEFVLPFKIGRDEVVKALHKHYGKRNFYLPKPFRSENHIQQVQGVYVPFWLYDTEISGAGVYDGSDSFTQRRGNYQVTTTRHYNVERAGTAKFEMVPVDGSRKMPDNYMDSLEPFDYTQLKPFSTAYLPGFLADRFDVSAEEASPRMKARCEETLEYQLRHDIDHSVVTQNRFDAKIDKMNAHYALLPVWMLTTKWQDKTYMFAMNGQTGKFVGELPTDKKLFWRNLAVLTGILTIFLHISGITHGILSLFG